LVGLAERLGARRVELTADTRNAASRRVAEKSGFVLEGILQRSRRDNAGELADSCLCARVF
jgi:ribosomal-protein-serine acetyltransferase